MFKWFHKSHGSKFTSILFFFLTFSSQVLSIKSLKKQMKRVKNMTVKDIVTTLVSFYWSVFLGLLHVAFSVSRGFCRIFSSTFMGGNLVEGAKAIKVWIDGTESLNTDSLVQLVYSFLPTAGLWAPGQHARSHPGRGEGRGGGQGQETLPNGRAGRPLGQHQWVRAAVGHFWPRSETRGRPVQDHAAQPQRQPDRTAQLPAPLACPALTSGTSAEAPPEKSSRFWFTHLLSLFYFIYQLFIDS